MCTTGAVVLEFDATVNAPTLPPLYDLVPLHDVVPSELTALQSIGSRFEVTQLKLILPPEDGISILRVFASPFKTSVALPLLLATLIDTVCAGNEPHVIVYVLLEVIEPSAPTISVTEVAVEPIATEGSFVVLFQPVNGLPVPLLVP